MKKILIVDDNAELRNNLADTFRGAGYDTAEASSGAEAVDRITSEEFNLVLLDIMMPGKNGIEILSEIKTMAPKSKVIMITAFATVGNAVDAIKRGASDYLSKPIKIDDLLVAVGRALEEAKFEEGVRKLAVDRALNILANPIRRNIIRLLFGGAVMRLMEITKDLGIDDHTKVFFHIKLLKDNGLIQQNEDKTYLLTREGAKILECLHILEGYLSTDGEKPAMN